MQFNVFLNNALTNNYKNLRKKYVVAGDILTARCDLAHIVAVAKQSHRQNNAAGIETDFITVQETKQQPKSDGSTQQHRCLLAMQSLLVIPRVPPSTYIRHARGR